jgi:hypothetical protein
VPLCYVRDEPSETYIYKMLYNFTLNTYIIYVVMHVVSSVDASVSVVVPYILLMLLEIKSELDISNQKYNPPPS